MIQIGLCSRLIRIVDFVQDTFARQSPNKFGFALDLFVSLHKRITTGYEQALYSDTPRCSRNHTHVGADQLAIS